MRESRIRIALDQSLVLQSFASSVRCEVAGAAIDEDDERIGVCYDWFGSAEFVTIGLVQRFTRGFRCRR